MESYRRLRSRLVRSDTGKDIFVGGTFRRGRGLVINASRDRKRSAHENIFSRVDRTKRERNRR